MVRKFPTRRSATAVLIAGAVLAATGCGSSGSTTATGAATAAPAATTGSATTAAPAAASAYSGPEAKLPSAFAKPQKHDGTAFTVGYLQITDAVPGLGAQANAAKAEIESLGGKMILKNANQDVQTQVSQFNDLMAQGVDAIIGYPVAVEALKPQVAKARAAGIPVVFANARPDVTVPAAADLNATVNQALDYQAWLTAKTIADAKPGASFATIGTGQPVTALKFLTSRQIYWGKQLGLKYLGETDTTSEGSGPYSQASTALLSKYSTADAAMTYNGFLALTLNSLARSSGHQSLLVVAGNSGETLDYKAIQAGQLFAAYEVPWEEIGRQEVDGVYDVLTKQGTPLPPVINLRGDMVTKDNVAGRHGV